MYKNLNISVKHFIFLLLKSKFNEAKSHSTFSTMVTMLIINEIQYIINILHHTTIFYKMPKNNAFSTLDYIFYTLIANSDLQNAENVICRKLMACRKCRTY